MACTSQQGATTKGLRETRIIATEVKAQTGTGTRIMIGEVGIETGIETGVEMVGVMMNHVIKKGQSYVMVSPSRLLKLLDKLKSNRQEAQ